MTIFPCCETGRLLETVQIEERVLGALYFSFGIGLGMFVIRLVLLDAIIDAYGSLSLEQTIILNIFVGSFIGSVLYNLQVDRIIEHLSRYILGRNFRETKSKNEGNLIDIAYVDIMSHRWESEVWESVYSDSKLAVKDAVDNPAIQPLLWNIKAGIFSGISVLLAATAIIDMIPLLWFISIMVIAALVISVPIWRNWDRELISQVAKMNWYREGVSIIMHKKKAGHTIDLGISPDTAQKLGNETNNVLIQGEYESFKRHSEILEKTLQKFGLMTAKKYTDPVLANYLYRAAVRDYSQSSVRTKQEYIELYKEIRSLFRITGSLEYSEINWMSISPTSETEPNDFFENIPLAILGDVHAVDKTQILDDMMRFIADASEEEAVKYLDSIGNSLLHHKTQLPKEVNRKLFKMLINNTTLSNEVGISIVVGILKTGISTELLEDVNPELVTRLIEIIDLQDSLEYLGIDQLQHYLQSIFNMPGRHPESKKEIQKHRTKYLKIGMAELVKSIDKK